jgi:uncharacterized protein (TIGR03118 family)
MKKQHDLRIIGHENATNHPFYNFMGAFYYGVLVALMLIILSATLTGCSDDDDDVVDETSYQQINLVSDVVGYGATKVNPNMTNAWGIAIGPTGAFWIAGNGKAVTTIYDRDALELLPAISLNGSAPTGVVYNNTSGFNGSKYIYATEDGKIITWTSGTTMTVEVDRSFSGSSYFGLAMASTGGSNFLYAANFSGHRIDVFDSNFNFVNMTFVDPTMPSDYSPFNIYEEDGKLFVAYAKYDSGQGKEITGAGLGYISIFNADGSFVKRFASNGTLNAPWAIVDAPSGFGLGDNIILVGNFGDGTINVYNEDGDYKGQLKDNGQVMHIDGLWALAFPENGVPAGDQNQLFFTAGPQNETRGLFGYLKKR